MQKRVSTGGHYRITVSPMCRSSQGAREVCQPGANAVTLNKDLICENMCFSTTVYICANFSIPSSHTIQNNMRNKTYSETSHTEAHKMCTQRLSQTWPIVQYLTRVQDLL